MREFIAKKVEKAPPPNDGRGNLRGRPPDPKLTDLLLNMKIGDCYDINMSFSAVKARIYRVIRDRLGAQRRYIVRVLDQQPTTRVWRME